MGLTVIYLDTSIFLTYLKEEKDIPGCLEATKNIFADLAEDNCVIATSTITITEILRSTIKPKKYKIFKEIVNKTKIKNVDMDVAQLASKLRNIIYKPDTKKTAGICPQCGRKMKSRLETPDALHIATAISCGATRLYTSDNKMIKHGLTAGKLLDNLKIVLPSMYGQ